MTGQRLKCDRCKTMVEVDVYEGVTCGFYDTTGEPWSEFANKDEAVVCDSCMWKDPRYIAVYGERK